MKTEYLIFSDGHRTHNLSQLHASAPRLTSIQINYFLCRYLFPNLNLLSTQSIKTIKSLIICSAIMKSGNIAKVSGCYVSVFKLRFLLCYNTFCDYLFRSLPKTCEESEREWLTNYKSALYKIDRSAIEINIKSICFILNIMLVLIFEEREW